MPPSVNLTKDFACRANSSLLNHRVTLQLYELTHRSYAIRSVHAGTLARASGLQQQCSGYGAKPVRDDYRTTDYSGGDRSDVEGVYQSRPTRLGKHHPNLQSLHLVQDCRPARLVDHFDAYPIRQFYYLHNSLHRFGQKLR